MALVANYDSGEDMSSDDDDVSITPSIPTTSISLQTAQSSSLPSSSSSAVVSSSSSQPKRPPTLDPFFQDSSDDDDGDASLTTTSIGQFLPKPKTFADFPPPVEDEEGPIPPKKTYGDEEKPPAPRNDSYPNIMTKKVKGVVRIQAPSLKDFEDDEVSDIGRSSKFTQSMIKKGSGLFAILPQPKGFTSLPKDISFLKKSAPSDSTTPNAKASLPASSSSAPSSSTTSTPLPRSLIPDSVKNLGKRPPPSKLEEIKAKYMKQEANVVIVSRSVENKKALLAGGSSKVKKGAKEDSDDSDEDSSSAPNFFSFESGANNDIDEETLEKLKLPMPNFNQFPTSSTNQAEEADEDYDNEAAASSSTTVQQDFMKYVSKKKGKTGKGASEINFIDVKADDLRPDTTEWVKNLTDESAIPVRRGKGLGGMQKRKHQITYLAVEAKAREQELQQQWASNRANRRQTKMKYGF